MANRFTNSRPKIGLTWTWKANIRDATFLYSK